MRVQQTSWLIAIPAGVLSAHARTATCAETTGDAETHGKRTEGRELSA